MRLLPYFLALVLAVLGALKLWQLTQDAGEPHTLIYAMTAIGELALAAALVTRRFGRFAVWLGASAMGGAVIGTLWAMTQSVEPTACKCLGVTEVSSWTVFVVQGALLMLFGLCLYSEQPRTTSPA